MSAKLMTESKKKPNAKSAATRTRTAAAAAEASAKKAKAAKTKSDAKPQRVSALDAAAQVLKAAGKPMRAQELIATMAEQGLWKSPGGKTPHATLYAAMMREINAKGGKARFAKTDRGLFTYGGE